MNGEELREIALLNLEEMTKAIKKGIENYGENFINLQDEDGWTLAHHVATRGRTRKYHQLWNQIFFLFNPDFTIKNRDGNTPMHIIASYGFDKASNATFLDYLGYAKEHKFDFTIKNNYGETILMLVESNVHNHNEYNALGLYRDHMENILNMVKNHEYNLYGGFGKEIDGKKYPPMAAKIYRMIDDVKNKNNINYISSTSTYKKLFIQIKDELDGKILKPKRVLFDFGARHTTTNDLYQKISDYLDAYGITNLCHNFEWKKNSVYYSFDDEGFLVEEKPENLSSKKRRDTL